MYMAFNWHYSSYAVIEHLKFCKIVCVADNSILSKPELLTLSQHEVGCVRETYSTKNTTTSVFNYSLDGRKKIITTL